MTRNLDVIGRNAFVEFTAQSVRVPAKVDTGADSSAVWASNIYVDEAHVLHFTLFDKVSPYYSGQELITKDYNAVRVRSSSGHSQVRYRARMTVQIGERRIKAAFTLADRSRNAFPVLIGRRTLAGKFIVDVTHAEVELPQPSAQVLNDELQQDPYEFHKKYHDTNNDMIR